MQTRIPFTSLRFSRPRLPTPGQAINLVIGLLALGIGAYTLKIANQTESSLDQSRVQLAMNTRGATAGRLAADQLTAQAQADTAQMMAAQDAARRAAASAPGFAPSGGYYPAARPADSSAPAPYYGAPSYGQSSYGQGSYAQGSYGSPVYGTPSYSAPAYGSQPTSAPSGSGGAMGYTLPQSPQTTGGIPLSH